MKVDPQELYNRLKLAEFKSINDEVKDFQEGYNRAIEHLTQFLIFEYDVKPLPKDILEKLNKE